MEYMEEFKSRFQNFYTKTREVPKVRGCIVEKLTVTRRTTRAQYLTQLRNINKTLSPSPVLMVSEARPKKMDRLERMKIWKLEKIKKADEEKNKRMPLFKVGAKANIGFPKLDELKQSVKKSSFAPKNHVFKAPVNVRAIGLVTVDKPVDTFKRVTRSQKAHILSPLTCPTRTKINRGKLTRQKAFDGSLQVENNTKKESNTKMTVNKNNKVQKVNGLNKENIHSNEDVAPKKTATRSKRRSFGTNLENNETSEKNTLNEKNISDTEDKTTKQTSNKKQSKRKSTSKSEKDSFLNSTFEFITLENTSLKDDVFSPVAAHVANKRKSLRLSVQNNEKPENAVNEETSKKRTSSKRKSMQKTKSEVEENPKKTSNKRQSRRKSNRKSISRSNTDKESSDSNSTNELINLENQTTPLKDDVFSPVAVYISPFVTTSRGKGSIKKENKERSGRGLPSFTEFNTEDEEANSSFQITGASYFHSTLNNQISRLTTMCETWNTYKSENQNLSEDSIDLIDVAVGQANLLINKKFQQFRKLIVSCENGYGEEKPVTCQDLQGFWDMIYIQVENLNTRFNRLTELKNHNWQEIVPIIQKKIVKKGGHTKRVKSTATSSLRATIEAARKKTKSTSSIDDTVFNGGYFVIKSPQKLSNTPETLKTKTPGKDRRSLLKSVLSSETKKSNRKSIGSPGVSMMKASQTAKSVENLNFTLPTPGKSILKKNKSIRYSSKAVLFQDDYSEAE